MADASNTVAWPPAATTSARTHSKSSRVSARFGKRVHGVLERDGAEVLKTAPDLHADAHRPRRQLQDEEEPRVVP